MKPSIEDQSDPLGVDRSFFTSLLEARIEALNRLLSDDFILIDVMSGSEITKSMFLSVIESGQLQFAAIEPLNPRMRLYGKTAVINGQTQMSGQFGEMPFTVKSRYTHVYVDQQGQWRMVVAQGTQISAELEKSKS
jgi:hypothetical protein